MVCCAFAVLVLLPLLVPVRSVWKRARGGDGSVNRAVEWSLHGHRAADPSRPPRVRPYKRLAATALGIGIVVAIGAASVRSEPRRSTDSSGWSGEPVWYDELHIPWCGTFDLAVE